MLQFSHSLKFRRLLPRQSPKIERLCWSRSCRDEAFIEWAILLTNLSKTSGQSSCAVIALISQWSQTQLRSAAYSLGVEPSAYHHSPPSAAHNLIVWFHAHWTLHKSENTLRCNKTPHFRTIIYSQIRLGIAL